MRPLYTHIFRPWAPWFAWRPVQVDSRWYWMCRVWRRKEFIATYATEFGSIGFDGDWEYTAKQDGYFWDPEHKVLYDG